MNIDLRRTGNLGEDNARKINNLEKSIRLEYNDFIEELIQSNNVNELTWLLKATSRNTHQSLIHDSFCRIALLDNILKTEKKIEKVLIDSKSLKSPCEQVIKANQSSATVIVKHSLKQRYIFSNLIRGLLFICCSYIVPKLINGKKIPDKSIIYLENFLFSNSFNCDGILNDRYYPGLFQGLSEKVRSQIWFAPVMIGINSLSAYVSVFKSIRKSNINFLMKEDFLHLIDYLKALKVSNSLYSSINFIPSWRNLNVSDLVIHELLSERNSPALINSILMYLFIKRLRQKKVDINLVIDWNENQVIDRALNIGFRKFYPGVKIKGYQGYAVPDYYACKDPTCYEVSAGTIPDEICVIGAKFIDSKKKYCKDINVSIAPAFRFSGVLKLNKELKKSNIILIILPISLIDSKEIIAICLRFSKLTKGRYKLILKNHPSYTFNKFIKLIPESLDSCFHISEKPVNELLTQCSLLISSWSSVCLEAAVLNIPVAISGSLSGPSMNPLEGLNEIKMWRLCYNESDILNLIESEHLKFRIDINQYFNPITSDSIEDFLRL